MTRSAQPLHALFLTAILLASSLAVAPGTADPLTEFGEEINDGLNNPASPTQTSMAAMEPTENPDLLPPDWLTDHDVVQQGLPKQVLHVKHDWDQDGLADPLDPVNLPSEAQALWRSTDQLLLPQGLGAGGFLLLVEPAHEEAKLITTTASLTPPLPTTITLDAALDAVQANHGLPMRNALANVLPGDIVVHHIVATTNTPTNDALAGWDETVQTDGSWLIVHADPTRPIRLILDGVQQPLADPAASRTTTAEYEYRWQFLNVHDGSSFCYDPGTLLEVGACETAADPGWVRAYSGRAAYSLEATQRALHDGLMPLTSSDALPDLVVPTSASNPLPDLSKVLPDADDPWQLIGNNTELPAGVGIDYLVLRPEAGVEATLVTQALDATGTSDLLPRLFGFRGAAMRIPGEPQDLRHITLGIESIDGDHGGQWFVLSGRALDEYLDLGEHAPVLEIDADHEDGFEYHVKDVDGDGFLDAVFYVPHFSEAWLTAYSSETGTFARFWDMEYTGPEAAWVTGSDGAVYKYTRTSGGFVSLQRFPIQTTLASVSSNQAVHGLHLVHANEFYVAGEGDCGSLTKTAFVAHYDSGWQSVNWLAGDCDELYDVWVSPDQSTGYTGGTSGTWFTKGALGWQPTGARPPSGCWYRDIELDSNGNGFVAALNTGGSCTTNGGPIFRAQSGSFSSVTTNGFSSVYDVLEPAGTWAAGVQPTTSNAGIFREIGTTWSALSQANPPKPGEYHSVARSPTGDIWFAGGVPQAGSSEPRAHLVRYDGAWRDSQWQTSQTITASTQLHDVEFYAADDGLAVGNNVILRYKPNEVPVAAGSLSATTLTTQDTLQATSQSYDPDNDPLSYIWDWGDATPTATTPNAAHEYNQPGSYTVWHQVDDGDDQDVWTRSVTVTAETLTLGSTQADSFAASTDRWHHYRIAPSSVDRVIQVALSSSNTDLVLLANADAPVSGLGTWPGEAGHTLAGWLDANKALYVAVHHPSGAAAASYSLTATHVLPPPAPSLDATSPASVDSATATVTATQPQGLQVRFNLNWGDGNSEWYPSTGFMDPGDPVTLTHAYSTHGDYTLTTYALDEFGQQGSSRALLIDVWGDPTATALALDAADRGFYEVTVQGQVDDLGGAPEVDARYHIALASTPDNPLQSSTWTTYTSAGLMAEHSFTGLQSGTSYVFWVEADSGLGSATSNKQSFSTRAELDSEVIASAVNGNTRDLGAEHTLQFSASTQESVGVRYEIDWGDGRPTTLVPATGWLSDSTAIQSASYTYRFPGIYVARVQLENQDGARSQQDSVQLIVSDSGSVTTWFEARDVDAVLYARTNVVVADGSTQARWRYDDPVYGVTRTLPWSSYLSDGNVHMDGSLTLFDGVDYTAYLDLRTTDGASWTSPGMAFRNAVPATLTPLSTTPSNPTYLDEVTFRVLYEQDDGRGPTSGNWERKAPLLDIGTGTEYIMYPESGAHNYRTGVEYTYTFAPGELPVPATYMPAYRVDTLYRSTPSISGNAVKVTQASVLTQTFESGSEGNVPVGFSKSVDGGWDPSLNYWRLVDSSQDDVPTLAALGNHGLVAWFGKPATGNYDAGSGIPRGHIVSASIDLRSLQDPSLSFSTFWETEDLTSNVDRKLVSVRSQQADGSWGSWSQVHVVSGLDGGYKKWRSHSVDLAAYEQKIIQVRFTFDAVNAQNNHYWGWFLDDVSIGYDHDDDQLPDDLERKRLDVRTHRQAQPVPVPSGGEATSAVRRVYRENLDHPVISSLIRHPDPSRLDVWLGAADEAGKAYEVKVVNDGNAIAAPCGASPLDTPSFGTGSGQIATQTEDGLRVQLDMGDCANKLHDDTSRDWFVRVAASSGGDGVIEDLRFTAASRTRYDAPDSDLDGRDDRLEVNGRGDPVGYDGDRDDLHEDIDPDDTVPSWMPAFWVSSPNYDQVVNLAAHDAMAFITVPSAQAKSPAGAWVELPLESGDEAASWVVGIDQGTLGFRPVEVRWQWQDAYGNHGHVGVEMATVQNVYAPTAAFAGVADAETGLSTSFRQPAGGGADYGFLIAGTTTVAEVGAAVAPFVLLGLAVLAAPVILGSYNPQVGIESDVLVLAGVVIVDAVKSPWTTPVGQQSVRTPAPHATKVLLPSAVMADLADKGITELEVKDALRNAQGHVDDLAGGVNRWFYEVGSTVYIMVTTGAAASQSLKDGYEIQLPSAIDWKNVITIKDVLLIEAMIMAEQGRQLMEALQELPAHEYGEPGLSGCTTKIQTALVDGRNGAEVNPEFVIDCRVWDAFVKFLRVQKQTDMFLKGQSITDSVIGTILWHLSHEAANKLGTGEIAKWYWDEGDQQTFCNGVSNSPDVRRCMDSNVELKKGGVELSDFVELDLANLKVTYNDFFDYHWLDFQGESRSLRDVLVAKGTVLKPNQVKGSGGQESLDRHMEQIEQSFPDVSSQAVDGVKSAYVVQERTGGRARVVLDDI